MEKDIIRIITRQLVTEPLANALSGMGSNMGGFFNELFGFANGGRFVVGGAGGMDSQLVAFKASPGEEVSVRTPQQRGGGATIVNNNYFSVAPGSPDTMVQSQQQIADATYKAASRAARRLG